jgi:3-hydroxyisobutyrate dehydrogenase-like beta-hydroxyacid dehydrogenase
MVSNLAVKGNLSSPLIVYNRSKHRSDDLNAKLSSALTVASTIPEAVTPADIVFSCIGDDKSVTDTFAEILKLDVNGKLFVECSTIHPDTTSALEKLVLAQGARFIAMPVFGAPAMADAGQLICVPSGPAADVDAVRPYLVGVYAPFPIFNQ